MAMKYLDMTGKTEEEAVSRALAQLGLDRDEVSVEILERAKSGFFGIGASPAKVRVTYGLEEPEVELAPKAAPAPKPAEKKPEAPKPAAKPVEKAEEKPQAVPASAQEAPRAEKPERKKKKKPAEKPQRRDQEAAGEEEINIPLPEPEELGEPCGDDDEKAKQIRTFLEGLLQHMDSAAQVTIYQPEKGRYKVILGGEKLGALIGRRGETLDAIQQLTNYSVNRGSDKRVRIHVDAENYRLKREQSLQHLARKVAAKVIKYKRNVTLEPMNAYERHVIHTALQDVENVTTYSMGTEPNRRVIVAYDRENKG